MWGVRGLFTYILSTNVRSFALFAYFAGCLLVLWIPVLYVLRWIVRLSSRYHDIPVEAFWTQYLQTLFMPISMAIVWLCLGLYFHMNIIRRATGAREVSRQDEPRLYNALENLAMAAGLPMPRVELIETDAANAFAYGLVPSDAAVAVTRGLLQSLNDRELQAVLAHELMHIKHRDVQVHVVATILMGLVTQQSNLIWMRLTRHKTPLRELFHAHPVGEDPAQTAATQKRRLLTFLVVHVAPFVAIFPIVIIGVAVSSSLAALLTIVAAAAWFWLLYRESEIAYLPRWRMMILLLPVWGSMILGGFLAAIAYLVAAVTTGRILRSRELLADAASVELTKDAQALCSALLAVSGRDRLESVDDATMALMISGTSGGWLATHPTVDQRIAALKTVAPDLFLGTRGNRKFADPALFGPGAVSDPIPPSRTRRSAASLALPVTAQGSAPARAFGRRTNPPR